METLLHNISQVLGITILHSLWQGLLIYLLLNIILSAMPTLSSAKKHNVSFAAVLLMATWFVSTLILEAGRVQWLANEVAAATIPYNYVPEPSAVSEAHPDNNYSYIIKGYLPYITVVYLIGLLFNILRLCFALRNISLVKQSLTSAGQLENAVKKFSQQLAIKKEVLVSYSRMVSVPGVIGYLKPILLMPVAITNHLTTAEVEAIILHELSHIKRNDYLLNILQQVVSVLLFFNPFALLINRIINSERENCCDDEVIKITGQPLIYARALLTLEQSKPNNLQLALAATGKRYSLLNRIERIMTAKKLTVNVRHILAAVLLFAFSLGSIAWLNPEIKNDHIKLTVVNPLLAGYLFQDTVPAVKSKKHNQHKVTRNTDETTTITNSDDPELERLAKAVEKEGEAIGKVYESADFKKLSADMELTGKEMEKYFNNVQLKKLEAAHEAFAKQFDEKWAGSTEIKNLNEQIEKSGKSIDAYYNNPEYKKLEKTLETESRLLDKAKPNSAEAKLHMKNIQETSKKISEYVSSPKIMQQQNLVKQVSEKLQQYYTSEDFKTLQASLSRTTDSLTKAFKNPAIVFSQQKMQALSKQMEAYQNSPQMKAQQQRLQAASTRLTNYINSPAYKKRMQQIQREVNIVIPEALE
ncbi:MAG: hypothetical protein EOP46_19530, partial [Sphingobacteriaceae bacterium]